MDVSEGSLIIQSECHNEACSQPLQMLIHMHTLTCTGARACAHTRMCRFAAIDAFIPVNESSHTSSRDTVKSWGIHQGILTQYAMLLMRHVRRTQMVTICLQG